MSVQFNSESSKKDMDANAAATPLLGDNKDAVVVVDVSDAGAKGVKDSQVVDPAVEEDDDKVPFPPLFVNPSPVVWLLILATFLVITLICTVFRGQLIELTGGEGVWVNGTNLNAECGNPEAGRSADTCFVVTFLKFMSIPLVMVPFTYAHIWLALWLMFYPTEFNGGVKIPGVWQIGGDGPFGNMGFPLGWQGIVSYKRTEMAMLSCRIMMNDLLNIKEIFAKLDPDYMVRLFQPAMEAKMELIVDQIAMSEFPSLWVILPLQAKAKVREMVHAEAPAITRKIMEDFQQHGDEMIAVEDIVIKYMEENPEFVTRMFIEVGCKELTFIRNCGATLGAVFGIIQMIIWYFYQGHWFHPVYGLFIGAATNWIALLIIFHPINPVYIFGIKFHGLFLQRQVEVATTYARVVVKHVLTTRVMIEDMVSGPASHKMVEMVEKHTMAGIDSFTTSMGMMPLVKKVDPNRYDVLKRSLSELIAKDMYQILMTSEDYLERTLAIEEEMREGMKSLSHERFERILHPVFEADEWKLVLMGGVLGVFIGLIQSYALF